MLENSVLAGIPGTGTFLRDIPGKNGIVGSYAINESALQECHEELPLKRRPTCRGLVTV